MGKVTRAVITAAGLGTRMLPATRAVPKEMLPVVDKPLLQYAVEEAAAAGITDIVFVVADGKEAVREHFTPGGRTEMLVAAKGDPALDAIIQAPPRLARFHYVHQDRPLGPGHAVLCARPLLGDQPFVLMFPDDLILGESAVAELVAAHDRTGGSVIAVERVPRTEVSQYGVVDPAGEGDPIPLRGLVEKPPLAEAPSDLAIVGRYVLTPSIFEQIERAPTGKGGEKYVTEGLAGQISAGEGVFAACFSGRRFDTGRPAGYLAASVAAALMRPELAADVHQRISTILGEGGTA
jgi:UTP--glucose-1-phosphate uridylyltransferase